MGKPSSVAQPLRQKLGSGDWTQAEVTQTEAVRVEISVEAGRLDEVRAEIENQGGDVISAYGQTIIASVQAGDIYSVGGISGLRRMNEHVPPEPHDLEPIRVNEEQ